VVAGSAKGHKLKTLSDNSTRPTSDRVKEALFSIIANYIPDADVIDLFAGTGSLGIEALSRGAKKAVFVDKSKDCYELIKGNLEHTKLTDKAVIIATGIQEAIPGIAKQMSKFDIILMDPPYRKNLVKETLTILSNNDIMNENCIIIAEHDKSDEVPSEVGRIKLIRTQKYKDTILSIYKREN
jgi:16S rRNA (guanine(966)-N(2))-methyltransferase RsmD